MTVEQTVSSKYTSVNTARLPAIYHKIAWDKLRGQTVLDYGAGRPETQRMIKKYLSSYGVRYIAYDPYWGGDVTDIQFFDAFSFDLVICSSVLNVLNNNDILYDVIRKLISLAYRHTGEKLSNVFISVYEGDKSGTGKQTGKDKWQRNEKTLNYLSRIQMLTPFQWEQKRAIITNNKELIK